MALFQRECVEDDACLFPPLRTVGHAKCAKAQNNWLPPSTHSDIYEIFYFVRGRVRWWVKDITYELSGNNIIIHPPGTPHGSPEGVLHPSEYYWVQLHAPSLRRLKDGKWNCLLKGLEDVNSLSFQGIPELCQSYRSVLAEIRHPDALSLVQIETLLMQIVTQVLRCHGHPAALGPNCLRSEAIARSVAWCEQHLVDATIEDMCREARMHREHFRSVFVKEMGLTPLSFIHRKKIDIVKTRLLQGDTVTQVAHALGFSSSQHLATLFRKIEGFSPTDFLDRA